MTEPDTNADGSDVNNDFTCPVCFESFSRELIENHVNACLEMPKTPKYSKDNPLESKKKKIKLDHQAWGCLAPPDESPKPPSSKSPSNTKLTQPKNSNSPSTSLQLNTLSNDNVPLAEKMRPNSFDEYFGQDLIVGKTTVLRKLLEENDIPSIIFWGPPGCGKTSIINVISKSIKTRKTHKFYKLSATSAGVSDVKKISEAAKNDQRLLKMKTILFIDEIHRFNKAQQDAFLPHVENGTIVLLGATTENPSFSLNNALISRCKVAKLEQLQPDALLNIVHSAMKNLNIQLDDGTHEPNKSQVIMDKEALDLLINICNGDARLALSTLETANKAKQNLVKCSDRSVSNDVVQNITVEDVKQSLLDRPFYYDRKGDEHYNCISAFIKSMRGSDANAALYWMSRMLNGGEDPKFIARRMIIFASEDVGLADNTALNLANSTFQSCQVIGLPECGINLAHCAVYLSRAPKSTESYLAYQRAFSFVKNFNGSQPHVPVHLHSNSKLPINHHSRYLPDSILDTNFFASP